MQQFRNLLAEGKPNTLGKTEEVADYLLKHPDSLQQLFDCYFDEDAGVQQRTSYVLKRICKAQPTWLVPYIDILLDEVAYIPDANTQWTLAQLLLLLDKYLTAQQRAFAKTLLKRPFDHDPQHEPWHDHWIVLNQTMGTLQKWCKTDLELRAWFVNHLRRLSSDSRNSIGGRATKFLHVWDK